MKKLFLTIIAVVGLSVSTQAQEGFRAGAHVGFISGDFSDLLSLNVGVDVSYLFNVADSFDAGFASGYSRYFGKDTEVAGFTIEVEDAGFIPLAGTARYSFSDNFFGAFDIGYALNTDSDADGGLYYQPKVGYKTETMDVFAFYKGISNDGSSINSIGAGVAFKL